MTTPAIPLAAWMVHPAQRKDLALYLAGLRLAHLHDMEPFITDTLATLAGHLPAEQREACLLAIVEALREKNGAADHEIDRACARVDDAVADLCEVAS